MSVWKAVLLGIIQGLTEFLPVSSSGHLVLFGALFGLEEPDLTFDVMVHLGTLVAVVAALRTEVALLFQGLRPMKQGPIGDQVRAGRRLLSLLIIGTLPAAIVGLVAKDFVEQLFGSVSFVGIALIVRGSLLWWAEGKADGNRSVEEMRPKDALQVGVLQVLALAPGISRSGTTISGGLARGFTRSEAARYSFLLSLPVIAGAVILQAEDVIAAFTGGTWAPLLAGTVAAALSGYIAIQGLLKLVRHHSLRVFSYYTWAVGILVLISPHFLR